MEDGELARILAAGGLGVGAIFILCSEVAKATGFRSVYMVASAEGVLLVFVGLAWICTAFVFGAASSVCDTCENPPGFFELPNLAQYATSFGGAGLLVGVAIWIGNRRFRTASLGMLAAVAVWVIWVIQLSGLASAG